MTSTIGRRTRGAFEHLIDVRDKNDEEIASIMRRLEIDIAVDLMGFIKNNRLNVLARRSAPIQINYVGYPGTMGAAYIDYIVANSTIIPEQHCGFYEERVIWLPENLFRSTTIGKSQSRRLRGMNVACRKQLLCFAFSITTTRLCPRYLKSGCGF